MHRIIIIVAHNHHQHITPHTFSSCRLMIMFCIVFMALSVHFTLRRRKKCSPSTTPSRSNAIMQGSQTSFACVTRLSYNGSSSSYNWKIIITERKTLNGTVNRPSTLFLGENYDGWSLWLYALWCL